MASITQSESQDSHPETALSTHLIRDVDPPDTSTRLTHIRTFTHHLAAARALSYHLNSWGIRHVYIGGFAWSLLGSIRPTEDIDVLIQDRNLLDLREKLRVLDPHFAGAGIKLYYVTKDLDGHQAQEERVLSSSNNVLVETLSAGTLGLPVSIVTKFQVGEFDIEILHPGILILTKFKRWSVSYLSTRPKTIRKAASDRTDIQYIIEWLAENREMVRFHEYSGKTKPELLAMIRKYHARYVDDIEQMDKLRSIMPHDWDDMLALPEPELESDLPP
ncbi:hypothetical protein C8Q78DRAFT_1031475 [Trametes maxima]|nr:hypothetical protein C8Q78DRAFT_1031475 [Trametes maxima]